MTNIDVIYSFANRGQIFADATVVSLDEAVVVHELLKPLTGEQLSDLRKISISVETTPKDAPNWLIENGGKFYFGGVK